MRFCKYLRGPCLCVNFLNIHSVSVRFYSPNKCLLKACVCSAIPGVKLQNEGVKVSKTREAWRLIQWGCSAGLIAMGRGKRRGRQCNRGWIIRLSPQQVISLPGCALKSLWEGLCWTAPSCLWASMLVPCTKTQCGQSN